MDGVVAPRRGEDSAVGRHGQAAADPDSGVARSMGIVRMIFAVARSQTIKRSGWREISVRPSRDTVNAQCPSRSPIVELADRPARARVPDPDLRGQCELLARIAPVPGRPAVATAGEEGLPSARTPG